MAVKDITEGSLVRTDQGFEVTRTFLVSPLPGTGASAIPSATLDPDLPAFRSTHPNIAGIFASRIEVSSVPGHSELARVAVTYTAARDPTQPYTEWTFERFARETWVDKDGNPLLVDAEDGGVLQGEQRHRAWYTDFVATARVTIARSTENVKSLADTYANAVNVATWSGYAEKLVLCKGFENASNGDATSRITGEFSIAPSIRGVKHWQREVTYIRSGLWFPGSNPLISQKYYDMYKQADFNLTPFRIT